jgi:hypothetical protein
MLLSQLKEIVLELAQELNQDIDFVMLNMDRRVKANWEKAYEQLLNDQQEAIEAEEEEAYEAQAFQQVAAKVAKANEFIQWFDGEEKSTGYAVGTPSDATTNEFPENLDCYHGYHAWENYGTDNIVVTPLLHFDNLGYALDYAVLNNEELVFDLATGQTIWVRVGELPDDSYVDDSITLTTHTNHFVKFFDLETDEEEGWLLTKPPHRLAAGVKLQSS